MGTDKIKPLTLYANLYSHLPEEIGLFEWKASGDTLKIQKPPAKLIRPIAIHTNQKYLNPSGDPVTLNIRKR